MADRLILIDAYSQIYRVFYAIRMLNSPSGAPCNAVYGMARLFLHLHQHYPSELGAIVFDKGKCTRRCALHPEYKAQRPPMPPALREQLALIRQWAEAFGWPAAEREGAEADDLICGLTHAARPCSTLILTGDKDIAQLTALDNVRLLVRGTAQKPWNEEGAEAVRAKFGVAPQQLRDYLALIGDSADNIPGLAGCGSRTAARLLTEFGNLEGIYRHIDAVRPQKLREALAAGSELLRRNQSLISLDCLLPEGWSGPESLRRQAPDWKRLTELAQHSAFKSLLETFEQKAAEASATRNAPQQLSLF